MRESELLAHIYERSARATGETDRARAIVVGPGDDCAVLRVAGELLVSTDQLIVGRHASPGTPVELIARKAVARSLSDIAAMAGTPLGAVCAAALPGRYTLADELFDAAHRAALALRCPLVGGDIAVTEAEHPSLTVTVFGAPHAGRGPVLRSTARPGDLLFVSGALGGAWRRGGKRHLTFTPRVELAAAIASAVGDGLTAMIDLSDGLGIDAGRVAAASGVRIDIEGERVPIAEGAEGLEAAMGEGEDYELAFTVSPGVAPRLESVARAAGVALTRVGAVSAGSGCFVRTRDGEARDASSMGFDHGADS